MPSEPYGNVYPEARLQVGLDPELQVSQPAKPWAAPYVRNNRLEVNIGAVDDVNGASLPVSIQNTPTAGALDNEGILEVTSATSVELLPANANRVDAIISNNAGGVVYVALGKAAVVGSAADASNHGIYLAVGERLDLKRWQGSVEAIAAGTTAYVTAVDW